MNPSRLYSVIRRPHISEKSTFVAEQGNQYIFEVALDANKQEIKSAVEQLFEVTVESVRTVRMRGKNRIFRGRAGKQSDFKKAYVRLREGDSIDTIAVEA